jgi:hypothetical protein
MMNNRFSERAVKHMCVILRMQKAALNMGDEAGAREYAARYNGFMDALSLTLSGPYIAALTEQVNALIKEEKEA